MKISILTLGSRGDVQPFVALGEGLQHAGHEVKLVTHERFREFITSHGLDFSPLAGDPEALLKSDVGQQMISSEKKMVAIKAYLKMLEPLAIPCAQDALDGCRDADLVLCTSSAYMYGEAVGEYYHVPMIQLSLYPMAPLRLIPPGPLSTPWPKWALKVDLLGGHWYHQKLILDLQSMVFQGQTNRFRKEVFGLPPRGRGFGMKTFSRNGHTWIYAYSGSLIPKPADWGPRQHVTGWCYLDEVSHWQPPKSLVDFLDHGSPPVYVGFGSMYTPDRERIAGCVMEALRKTGQRAILAKGWGLIDPKNVSDDCYLLDAAPHEWLFPRMAGVIHHGGAGTTGAGARAGVPNLVVPFAYDQPFWGRALHAAGIAPPPIPAKKLTADNLTGAIQRLVGDSVLRNRAAILGETIRAEDGVQKAIDIIEEEYSRLVPARPPSPHALASSR